MILTSKNNPMIKEIQSLKDKKFRRELGLFLVEGTKMVSECKKSGYTIEKTVVAESYSDKSDGDICVSDDLFKTLSDEKTPQGILALVRIPERTLKEPSGNSLLLDGVSDPGNLGTIIRTANAAGYNEIYLVECADPYSPKCVRASMSGIFFTTLYFGTREEVLAAMQKSGTPVITADMDGENIFTFQPPEKFALAIGNEANGISDEVMAFSKYKIGIPMRSTQESLNAGVSAGIAMYVLQREQFTKKQ